MGKPLTFRVDSNVPSSSIAPDDFNSADRLEKKEETTSTGTQVTWEGTIPLNIYKRGEGDNRAYVQIVQVEDADHQHRFAYAAFPCWNQDQSCKLGKDAVQAMMADAAHPVVWRNLPTYVEIGAALFGDVNGRGMTDLLLQLTDNTNMTLMQGAPMRQPHPMSRPPHI